MTATQLSQITLIVNLNKLLQLPQSLAEVAHSLSDALSSVEGDLTPTTTLRVSREYTCNIVVVVRIYFSSCGPECLRSCNFELPAAT